VTSRLRGPRGLAHELSEIVDGGLARHAAEIVEHAVAPGLRVVDRSSEGRNGPALNYFPVKK
jgi:hypothetical protein